MRDGRVISSAGARLIAAGVLLSCLAAPIARAEPNSQKAAPMPAKTTSSKATAAKGGAAKTSAPGKPAPSKVRLSAFQTAPFPFDGEIPERGVPFFDVNENGRKGRTTRSGTVYWQDKTYSDRRVLLALPRGFDPAKPILLVVFFHGNGATLQRDVQARQEVVRQVLDSGRNTVLIAPQLAVDAMDSSAGRFWQPGAFRTFLDEAAGELAIMAGGERHKAAFDRAPVVLAAYSGGYLPAAFSLQVGDVDDRVQGVILLDALYSELDKFRAFMVRKPDSFFVSIHTDYTAPMNQGLQKMLREDNLAPATGLPARLDPGTFAFLNIPLKFKPPHKPKDDEPLTEEEKAENNREREKAAGDLHKHFVNKAFAADPLRILLARVPRHAVAAGPVAAVPQAQDPNYVARTPKPRPKSLFDLLKSGDAEVPKGAAETKVAPEPALARPRPSTARQD